MSQNFRGLHHVGHVVGDMREAIERYRRLGFMVPPPSYPVLPPAPGEPSQPFGVANTHVYFPRNFIELVTILDEDSADCLPEDAQGMPLRVPDEKLSVLTAAIRSTVTNLTACLQRFQGVHILMFDASDLDSAAMQLEGGGVGHGGVHAVQRPVETVDGLRMEPVRYLEIDSPETGKARGRVPEGRVGFAENPSPEVLDAQQHLNHPNGAVGLVGCIMCVDAAELPDVVRRYNRYLDLPVSQDGSISLQGANIHFVTASALRDLLPGEQAPVLPAFVAITVTVRDIAATEHLLRKNGIPVRESASRDIFVPASAALGVAIIFRQAS